MPVISIKEIDDPRIAIYRDINRANPTESSDLFVVEGRWLVERLLSSQLQTESILLNRESCQDLAELVDDSIPVYQLADTDVSQLVGFQFHRGVLAVGRRPTNRNLEELVPEEATIVVCPEITDPNNLGGIIRSCSAFGVDGLILGKKGADPFSRRVIRVSMGSAFSLSIRVADDLSAELMRLNREFGVETLATVLDENAEPLFQAGRSSRIALLFGSESEGLPDEIVNLCDRRVTLSMQSGTDSLNVASSTSVFLYHFFEIASL